MNRRTLFVGLWTAAVAAALAGCGSSDNGGGNTATTPLALNVQWGARSKAVNAPSSALSAVVTIPHGKSDNTDFTWTIDRDAAPAAYTKSYTSTDQVTVGQHDVTVTFKAQASGNGDTVGVAQQTGVTVAANGTGVDNITTTNKVASVTVAPNQNLNLGETKDIQFTAHDASNNVVAITPGSVFLNSDKTNVLAITASQQAQAAGTGTAHVTATVDGVASTATAVSVNPSLDALKEPGLSNTQQQAVTNVTTRLAQIQNIPSVGQQLQAASLAPLATALAQQANGYIDQVKGQTPSRKRLPGDTWTYSVTQGGVTVAVSLTEGADTSYNWNVTLNGGAGGVTYNNFVFLNGTSKPDTLTGKSGWRSTLAFNSPPVAGQPSQQIATWDIFNGNDGTANGNFTYAGAKATLNVDAAKTFTLATFDTNNAKTADLSVAADGSGSAHAYCGTDNAVQSVTTFNALAQTGAVTEHATACGGTEGKTSSW